MPHFSCLEQRPIGTGTRIPMNTTSERGPDLPIESDELALREFKLGIDDGRAIEVALVTFRMN